MTRGVTAQGVAAQQDGVRSEDERANADADRDRVCGGVGEPEGTPHIVGEETEENQSDVQEVAMHVLQDQGERVFAAVVRPGLADGAGWRVRPERLVVSAPVGIAGEAGTTPRPEGNTSRRIRRPRRPP